MRCTVRCMTRRSQSHPKHTFPGEILYPAGRGADWERSLGYGGSRNHATVSGSHPALWHSRVCRASECPRTLDRWSWLCWSWLRWVWVGWAWLRWIRFRRAGLWRIWVLTVWVRKRGVFRRRIPGGEFCVSAGGTSGLRAPDGLRGPTDRVRQPCARSGPRTQASRSRAPESGVPSCLAEGLVSVVRWGLGGRRRPLRGDHPAQPRPRRAHHAGGSAGGQRTGV